MPPTRWRRPDVPGASSCRRACALRRAPKVEVVFHWAFRQNRWVFGVFDFRAHAGVENFESSGCRSRAPIESAARPEEVRWLTSQGSKALKSISFNITVELFPNLCETEEGITRKSAFFRGSRSSPSAHPVFSARRPRHSSPRSYRGPRTGVSVRGDTMFDMSWFGALLRPAPHSPAVARQPVVRASSVGRVRRRVLLVLLLRRTDRGVPASARAVPVPAVRAVSALVLTGYWTLEAAWFVHRWYLRQ